MASATILESTGLLWLISYPFLFSTYSAYLFSPLLYQDFFSQRCQWLCIVKSGDHCSVLFYLTSQLLLAQLTRPSFFFIWLCCMWDLVPWPVLEPVSPHWEHGVLITEWPGKSWPDLHFDVFSAGVPWLFCCHPSVPLSYSIPVAGLFLCFNWKCLNAPDIYPVPFAICPPLCRCSHSVSIRYSLCTDQNQLCVSNPNSPLSSEHSYPTAYFTYPRRFSISISNLSCHLCPWIMAKTSPLFPLLPPSPHHHCIQCLHSSQKELSKLQTL